MNENNWCSCAEFNALTQANHKRRVQAWAQRQAAKQRRSDRYYKRIVFRHNVRTVAGDVSLIVAMSAALFVLFRCVIWCL